MSGGSFDYMYQKILEQYEGSMLDSELEELLVDFCDLLHDLEWFESADIGEEDYRKTVADFKLKWFNRHALEKQTALTPDKIQEAVKQIERLANDKNLRDKLINNGLKTANEREWTKIEREIIDLYIGNKICIKLVQDDVSKLICLA